MQLVADGKASLDDALLFLGNSRAALERSGLPREAQRRRMMDQKVGGRVLAFFWDHREEATRNRDMDAQFADLLT